MRASVVLSVLCFGTSICATLIPSLLDATIDDLARLLDAGTVTSVDLVNTYFARIDEVNDDLHAIMELNPKALAAAKAADAARAAATLTGASLGPLHGIPILIKDNIGTMEMNNTAGSVCMLGSKVKSESPLVVRLRRAGAIILAKANMAEWAGARAASDVITSWSGYGGLCVGAYTEDQSPLGSSSGSAVAVSVGLAPVALGTETDGSIIAPSDHANLVGIKPTMGLTSRFGVIPITHRQDTVGPMCKSVADCARILSVIAGKDVNDNYTSLQPFDTPPDYTKFLDYNAFQGKRIGIPWNALDAMRVVDGGEGAFSEDQVADIMTVFNHSVALLEQAGATIISSNYTFLNASVEDFMKWRSANGSITFHGDMLASINEYLDGLKVKPNGISTFGDLINCTKHEPRELFPDVDMELWDNVLKDNYTAGSSKVWQAYQNVFRLAGDGAIFGALETFDLDALMLPSFAAYDLASAIGSPVVTVPMGVLSENVNTTWMGRQVANLKPLKFWAPGVPFGLSFFGADWSEDKLIAFAYAYEQRTHFRQAIKPIILPTTELPQRSAFAFNDDL